MCCCNLLRWLNPCQNNYDNYLTNENCGNNYLRGNYMGGRYNYPNRKCCDVYLKQQNLRRLDRQFVEERINYFAYCNGLYSYCNYYKRQECGNNFIPILRD